MSERSELPIACSLTADQLRAAKTELLPGVVRLAEFAEDIPDGRRYRFAPQSEILQAVARMLESERQCCRFLRFHLTLEPDFGPLWLEMTGPPGTREFLSDLVNS